MTESQRCTAKNKASEPCQAYAVADSEFCFQHDPECAEERRRARSKGGHARHGRKLTDEQVKQIEIKTPADVLRVVNSELGSLLTLEKSIARSRAVGYLASVALKAFEVTELEHRVELLEQQLSHKGSKQWRA